MALATRILLGCLITVAGATAGCGNGDDERATRDATGRFYAALRSDDGREACALLSRPTLKQLESQNSQACEEVITRLELSGGEITDAEVYVTNARVTLAGGESAFLTREPAGWRLSALGCVAREGKPRDRPLDCEVEA